MHDTRGVMMCWVREVSDVATGRRKRAPLEPTVALTVADLPTAVGRVITDVLEQSLVAVDDMRLTTAAATLGRRVWRNLSDQNNLHPAMPASLSMVNAPIIGRARSRRKLARESTHFV
jgi:hypothetical protein